MPVDDPSESNDERSILLHGSERLGLSLTLDQSAHLLAYLALLQKWNRTYNLTAVRGADEMMRLHLLDSLALVGPLSRDPDRSLQSNGSTVKTVVDVGSGGGLPGVVLAIMRPDLSITCVDKVGKKARFIQQVRLELALDNLHARHARVEVVNGQYDLIVSRAFASLSDFVGWTRHLAGPRSRWLAMKGRMPNDEIAQLPEWVQVFHVEQLDVPLVDAERCLIWLGQVHSRS